jgi:hypothetical protein
VGRRSRGDAVVAMIVIGQAYGRLANRLVLYAHVIAAAIDHGAEVANPSLGARFAPYFPAIADDAWCRFPARPRDRTPGPLRRRAAYGATIGAALAVRPLGGAVGAPRVLRLRDHERMDIGAPAFGRLLAAHRLVVIQGWRFRADAACAAHREVVKAHLAPAPDRLARAVDRVATVRRSGRLVVGVHVRRGDYARFRGGRYLYSHTAYRAAMEAVQAGFADRDVAFLVCSDEPVPVEAFAGLDVTPGPGHELDDLLALASCDRIVGPPSTYSRWAAFLGDVPRWVLEGPGARPGPSAFSVPLALAPDTDDTYVAVRPGEPRERA